jgi:Tfp pilus assembly protein PilX
MAKKRSKQKGYALLFALLLVLVISVMATALMFLSQSETWSSMNYRMMSQARYGAESGLNAAADFIVSQYKPPTTGGADSLALYDTTKSPVTLAGTQTPVVLSANSAIPSTYPVGSVVTAFQNALSNPGNLVAGNTTVNYNATATLLSMGTVNSYGNTLTVQMWQITADGTIDGMRNAKEEVTAVMEQQVTPATVYAAFATASGCGAMAFSGGGVTDSYDSSLLTVDAAGVATPPASFSTFGGNAGSNGNLAENGAPTTIYGTFSSPDTGVGNCSGGNVPAWTDNGNAQVAGGLVKLPQIVTFPSPLITAPQPGAPNESVNTGDITATPVTCGMTFAPNATGYGDINLNGHGVLCLTPGVYNINSISDTGANTGVVIVPYTTGPLTGQYGQVVLNVTGNGQTTPISLTGNGLQNPTLNPADLQINYAGTGTVKIAGNSESAMVIYAPNANVTLTGGSDFYGAVLGNTVTDAGGTAIHYDRNLSKNTYIVSNFMLDSFSWARF